MFPTGLNPDGYVRMQGIAMDIDWYKKNNLIKPEVRIENVVDNKYVDYAVKILGKYQ